jgi:hypothetical protein
MAEANDWQALTHALRDLHRALAERAKRDYERQHAIDLQPGTLLQLLTTDADFAWLRSLSELMADLDVLVETPAQAPGTTTQALSEAVLRFFSVPPPGEVPGAFAGRFFAYLSDDPEVAMAYAAVRRALTGLRTSSTTTSFPSA